jgi:HAD superfamily hydrolase (TIGR01493 family)
MKTFIDVWGWDFLQGDDPRVVAHVARREAMAVDGAAQADEEIGGARRRGGPEHPVARIGRDMGDQPGQGRQVDIVEDEAADAVGEGDKRIRPRVVKYGGRLRFRSRNEVGKYYDAVPTWGPHADVPEPLSRIAKEIPLVILSNAMDEQIHHNVAKLGAPFHRVYTAQQAQAYKPRLRAFEYMLDQLGCAPEELLHVSSSPRYDHMSANDMGIRNKAFVNRGHEPGNPAYGYREIPDIGGLPALVGL